MADYLARELACLRHGDHLCLPYDSVEERDEVIVPYIAEGLARGARCVYVIEAEQQEPLMARLAAAGVNAGRALERGALWLRTPDETYFRSGKFDAEDTLALADELIASALADGFTGVRASGDIGAPARRQIPWETIFSYEVRFNERFGGRPMVALCGYHRRDSSPTMLADALRTHPTAIVGGRVCRNPYYEKPDIALASDDSIAARVEWMLCQLRRTSASDLRAREMTRSLAEETARLSAENQAHAYVEDELERAVHMRDRFLDMLTEELSGPVAGLAAELQSLGQIAEQPSRDGRGARISALGGHLKRLSAIVEELKEVSRFTNRAAQGVDDVDLADVARRVTLRHRDRLAASGSVVAFRTEPRIQGRWDGRRIEQLMTNLVLNAGKRGAGRAIDLDLTTDGGTAMILVRYRGVLPPAHQDESAFEPWSRATGGAGAARGTEAGLWLSREIASALGGSMRVTHDRDQAQDQAQNQAPRVNLEQTGVAEGEQVTLLTVLLPRTGPRTRAPIQATTGVPPFAAKSLSTSS